MKTKTNKSSKLIIFSVLFALCLSLLQKETSYEVQLLRLIAELYSKGWGTEIHSEKAKEYFERAAIREKMLKSKFTW